MMPTDWMVNDLLEPKSLIHFLITTKEHINLPSTMDCVCFFCFLFFFCFFPDRNGFPERRRTIPSSSEHFTASRISSTEPAGNDDRCKWGPSTGPLNFLQFFFWWWWAGFSVLSCISSSGTSKNKMYSSIYTHTYIYKERKRDGCVYSFLSILSSSIIH